MLREWTKETACQAHDFAAFMKSPSLERHDQSTAPIRDTITTFIVLSILMIAVSAILLPFVLAMGAGQSAVLDSTMSVDPLRLVIAVVILGPLIEELLFRSWLSGKWRDLAATSAFAIVLYGSRAGIGDTSWGKENLAGYLTIAAAIAAYLVVRRLQQSTDRSAIFTKHFKWIFWISVVTFGALHLSNYSGSGGVALFIFTIPQMVAGAAFGFARIKIGLASAIALHMMYNSVPVIATLAVRLI